MLTIDLPKLIQQAPNAAFRGQFNTMHRLGDGEPLSGLNRLGQMLGRSGMPTLEDEVTGQIRDEIGWYDAMPAHILVAGNAEAIVTVGASRGANGQDARRLSVNAFRFIALNVPA